MNDHEKYKFIGWIFIIVVAVLLFLSDKNDRHYNKIIDDLHEEIRLKDEKIEELEMDIEFWREEAK